MPYLDPPDARRYTAREPASSGYTGLSMYMSNPHYFFWLAEQAFSGLVFAWPITVILLALVVATFIAAMRRRRLALNNAAWSLLPIVVPFTLLTWGVVFKQTGLDENLELTWQAKALYVLLVGQIPVAVLAIWRAVNARLLAAATAAFISHYSVWAAFVAGMSVTDDWL